MSPPDTARDTEIGTIVAVTDGVGTRLVAEAEIVTATVGVNVAVDAGAVGIEPVTVSVNEIGLLVSVGGGEGRTTVGVFVGSVNEIGLLVSVGGGEGRTTVGVFIG